jgi:hypothetical protein
MKGGEDMGGLDPELEAILAKDDTAIMLDELRELFGADIDGDSRFTIAQIMTAMERSFENGKALIQMLHEAERRATVHIPPSLSPGVGCELPIVAKLTFIDDAGEYEGTLVNPDGPEGAKLIEELVETLDGFVEARDRYLESDCDSHAEHMAANRLDEAHEAARAALARAKGDRA